MPDTPKPPHQDRTGTDGLVEVGRAIAASPGFGRTMEGISRAVQAMARWADANRDELRALAAAEAKLARAEEHASREGYRPLIDPLRWDIALDADAAMRAQDLDAVLALVEPGLRAAEPVEALCEELERPPVSPPRAQLATGLSLFLGGDDVSAVPLLMTGLEGLFAETALARGRAVWHDGRLHRSGGKKGRGRELTSADAVLGELEVRDEGIVAMLRRRVLSDAGNPFRHGTAPSGHRRQALVAVASLIALRVSGDLDLTLPPVARSPEVVPAMGQPPTRSQQSGQTSKP